MGKLGRMGATLRISPVRTSKNEFASRTNEKRKRTVAEKLKSNLTLNRVVQRNFFKKFGAVEAAPLLNTASTWTLRDEAATRRQLGVGSQM